ncbi:MAG: cyclic lactone autoinducer peptide [Ruminococcus sp.]|jgi:cyclic lactone autoinducer peptide|nr:cyclic lactone autoinducer peptide [Ruminococcus sp.]MCR5729351.1 cyclic lactone autoinducer peptide [Ruminococcus sp.]
MKNNKMTASVLKKVAGKMADVSCRSASIFGLHQPKEPAKYVAKNNK